MLCALPQPILSLAADALQSLRGEDAALDLFTLFTKCKHHIEEGPRLENLSLRIWHRDSKSRRHNTCIPGDTFTRGTHTSHSKHNSNSDSELPDTITFKSSQAPGCVTPVSDSKSTPVPSSAASITRSGTPRLLTPVSPRLQHNPLSAVLPLTESAFKRRPSKKPLSVNPHHQESGVGETIVKMLDDRLSISPRSHRTACSSECSTHRRLPPSLGRHDTESSIAESVNESEEMDANRSITGPLLVIPASPPSRNGSESSLGPKVVIVNPTPHPTPPATPDIHYAPGAGFFIMQPPNTKHDTLLPPEIIPTMRLPEAAVDMAVSHNSSTAGIGASCSTHGSCSTGSSDDLPPTTGKKFFMPRSSPHSQSPEKSRIMAIAGASAHPTTSTTMNHSSNDERVASSVASASSQMKSVASSSAGGIQRAQQSGRRQNKPTTRHARKGSKGRFALPAAKSGPGSGTFSSSQPKMQSSRKVGTRQNSLPSGSSANRGNGPDLGHLPSVGSPSKKSKATTSLSNPSPTAADEIAGIDADVTIRPNPLMRVATQPLPHAHQPNIANHNVFPQLQGLYLQQPLVPPVNGKRRKVEIEKSSEEEDWSDVSEEEEEDVEEEEEKEEAASVEVQVVEETEKTKAEKEASYHRDFFKKLPSRSYTNLTERSKSGLLTELFKPPVEWFPEDHAYRTSRSHLDLVPKRQPPGQGPMLWFKSAVNGNRVGHRPPISASPPAAAMRLSTSKSAVALPEMVKISAGAGGESVNSDTRSGYRPRGPPANMEASDSGEEDPDDAVQMSKSVVHRRLEALAASKRSSKGELPPTASTSTRRTSIPSPLAQDTNTRPPPPTRPMTIGYPYNLPAPEPPSSLATTRNRIWERELTQSTKVSLLKERFHSYNGGVPKKVHADISKLSPEKQAEELRKVRLMRTKSWGADDIHTSGW